MLHESDRLQGSRWSLLFAFVRAAAAALALFVGIVWAAVMVYHAQGRGRFFAEDMPVEWIVVTMSIAAVVSVLAVGVGNGYLESRELRRRMGTLGEAARLWAGGRLGHRIVEVGGESDEVSALAVSLNRMAGRLEEQVNALMRLLEENEQLQQQAATAATLTERARLARELHDSVSQQIFAIGMTAGAVQKLYDWDSERARPLVGQLEEMAQKAQAEMRALLLHLRPVELEGRSLAEALERFLMEVCARHGLRYDLEIGENVSVLGEGVEAQLFRIGQEAVSNVIRHAQASRVAVRLVGLADEVYFSVRDDGKGFAVDRGTDGSYGMKTLRERTEEAGGRLEIRTSSGAGTEVAVVVPILSERGSFDGNDTGDDRGRS